jgi:hypothetical protein
MHMHTYTLYEIWLALENFAKHIPAGNGIDCFSVFDVIIKIVYLLQNNSWTIYVSKMIEIKFVLTFSVLTYLIVL